jgi:hypothetical protein
MVLHESWIASTFGKNAVGHTIRRNAVTSNGMTADAERVSLQQLLGICISIYITMKLYQITYIMGHTWGDFYTFSMAVDQKVRVMLATRQHSLEI